MTLPDHNPPISALRVTLSRGERHCELAGDELDRLFGGQVSLKLTAILFSRPAGAGGKGTTGVGGATDESRTVRNVNVIENSFTQRSVPAREQASSIVEDRSLSTGDTDRLSNYLADRLADRRSLPFYRRVAAEVSAEVIREALVAALDLAPADVRKSRAAYFTAIVRPHLRPRAQRTPPPNLPYAPLTPST